MTTQRRLGILAGIAIVAGAAAAGIWWSMHLTRGYGGLARQYPDKVAIFCEIQQLGQWMPPSELGEAAAAQSESARGTDPMLQVLSQVWAAPPPIKSASLPDLLRNRPMAAGFWFEGKVPRGVALVPLLPGQREVVEKKAEELLGKGPEVANVEGISLRAIESPLKAESDFAKPVWGVSDRWAVMASSPDDLKAVLGKHDTSLAGDPVFRSAVKRFPSDRGAVLFMKGAELAGLVKRMEEEKPKKAAQPETGSLEPREEKPAEPEKEAPAIGGGLNVGEMVKALAGASKGALKNLASLESVASISLWTAPPAGDQKGWEAAFWLGLSDAPKGFWRVVSEGTPRSPQIESRVPKNGQVYVWGAGKDPGRLYQESLDEMQKALTPDQMSWIRAGIGAAEGKLDLSFANDLLPTLSDEWCAVTTKEEGRPGHMGFFLALKDARRFEDLVANKLAPQLKLVQSDEQGARVWRWGGDGKEAAPALIVSGGMAVITDAPAWALATGGSPGKAWKSLADFNDKANCLVVMDPAVWSKKNDLVVLGSCRVSPEGIFASARFPGEGPAVWGHRGGGGECASPEASGEESPSPAASGSI
jgi:hypothetical protein